MRSKKASLCYIQCSSWKHTSLFWACYLYPKMRKLLHFFCRKMSWTPTFVILFSANLVFYKDQKAAAQVPFDSTNWNFGQVVKICNFANFKITEMWPFLLCHMEGFSKDSPPPPIFWWIFIPYTTSSLYCTKVLLSLIMKTNSKLHYVAQVNLMNLRTA